MFNQLKVYDKNDNLFCSINNTFSLYSFYKYEKESYDRIVMSPNNNSCFLSIYTFKNGELVKEVSYGDVYIIKKVYQNKVEKVSRYNLEKDTMYSKLTLSFNGKNIEKDRYMDSKGKVEHNLTFKISEEKLNQILNKQINGK